MTKGCQCVNPKCHRTWNDCRAICICGSSTAQIKPLNINLVVVN